MMANKLTVNSRLLRQLQENDFILKEDAGKLKRTKENGEKVDELIGILERCDDSKLPKFFEILRNDVVRQGGVVTQIWPELGN